VSVVSPHLAALFIPSPGQGVWHLGPLPIRAYALCIIAGVIAAVWYGERRWVARGGIRGQVSDVAIWAVPFGLLGARSRRWRSGTAASASGARSPAARSARRSPPAGWASGCCP